MKNERKPDDWVISKRKLDNCPDLWDKDEMEEYVQKVVVTNIMYVINHNGKLIPTKKAIEYYSLHGPIKQNFKTKCEHRPIADVRNPYKELCRFCRIVKVSPIRNKW